jgi:hypothetical protein
LQAVEALPEVSVNDEDLLQRVYQDAGGVHGLPEHLRDCLPRGKHDLERAENAAALGFARILPHLLTWLMDRNWPVCGPIATFLF